MKYEVKGQGHVERKCKNVFRAYLRQNWIVFRHTKTKMIIDMLSLTKIQQYSGSDWTQCVLSILQRMLAWILHNNLLYIPPKRACRRDSREGDGVKCTIEQESAATRELVEAGTRLPASTGTRPRTGVTVSRVPAYAAGARAPVAGRRSARWRHWLEVDRWSRDAAEVDRGRLAVAQCWTVDMTAGTHCWSCVASGSFRRRHRRVVASSATRRRWRWWEVGQVCQYRCVIQALEDDRRRQWYTPPAASDTAT